MSATTRYERLSDQLVQQLSEQIVCGNNVVILSARFGGKSLAVHKLARELRKVAADRLIACSLFALPRITEESTAVRAMLRSAPACMQLEGPGFKEVFDSIRDYSIRISAPVIFLATDADAMDYQVISKFLAATLPLVACNQFTFVLSGESNLRDLLDEVADGLPFEEIMLAGYEQAEFNVYFNRWLERIDIRFENVGDARQCCFEQTGGNLNLAVALLKMAFEDQMQEEGGASSITVADMQRYVQSLAMRGPHGTPVFARASAMIASSPDSWSQLETLIGRKRVLPLYADGRPDVLEFAGLTVRRGAELEFASPLMDAFSTSYFDARRFGDLYARELNWEDAVEHYSAIPPDQRARPVDMHDRAFAAAVVNAVGARMNADARAGLDRLKVYLTQASAYLLALPEVIFWHWTEERGWDPQGSEPETSILEQARQLLPVYPPIVAARRDYPIQNLCSTGALLDCGDPELLDAVTMSDAASGRRIGPHRRKLARLLLNHFSAAYQRTSGFARERTEYDLRLAVSEAIASLYHLLFAGLPRLPDAMTHLRARLVRPDLGLSRLVLLPDESPPEVGGNSVADGWREREEKMHTAVLSSGTPERRSPAPDAPAVWLCLVPLDGRRLLRLERRDRAFSGNEMRILADFGKKLAVALEHGQRRSVLEAAFRSMPEPMIVCDPDQRVIYGNRASHLRFEVQEGWSDQPRALLSYPGLAGLSSQVNETLQKKVPRAELHLGVHSSPRHALVQSSWLTDWQDLGVGALLHIQDQTFYHEALEASQRVLLATTVQKALEATIDSFRQLGHKWIRFYRIEGSRLVPAACVDPDHPTARASFEAGIIHLPERSAESLSWRCMFEKKPVAFAWVTKDPRGEPIAHGDSFYTDLGIEVIADHSPLYRKELEKEPGDMWLDCPLLLPDDREFGKFTVQCSDELSGERLVMLRVFSDVLAHSIAVIQQHVQREHEAEEVGQETALDAVTHNMGSRLTTLIGYFDQYRALQKTIPQLAPLNERFAVQLQQILKLPGRAKDLARAETARRCRFDLAAAVRSFFETRMPAGSFTIHAGSPVSVYADEARLTDLLAELLANSQHFVQPPEKLHITVFVDLAADGNVRVVYRDNGPGIPVEYKKRIFTTFFSRRAGDASSGLGMSVVWRVVHAHGGTIEETGATGTGAEFTIIMPIADPLPGGREPCSEYSSSKT